MGWQYCELTNVEVYGVPDEREINLSSAFSPLIKIDDHADGTHSAEGVVIQFLNPHHEEEFTGLSDALEWLNQHGWEMVSHTLSPFWDRVDIFYFRQPSN